MCGSPQVLDCYLFIGVAVDQLCLDYWSDGQLWPSSQAAIICKDVNLRSVAPKIFRGAMYNSGQVCIAIKRVFVHESQYDELCDLLVLEAKKAKFGDGMDAGVQCVHGHPSFLSAALWFAMQASLSTPCI
jgi:hypothetical protein